MCTPFVVHFTARLLCFTELFASLVMNFVFKMMDFAFKNDEFVASLGSPRTLRTWTTTRSRYCFFLCKNDDSSIENDDTSLENDEPPLKIMNIPLNIMMFVTERDQESVSYQNDDSSIENDDSSMIFQFLSMIRPLKNDEFCRPPIEQ